MSPPLTPRRGALVAAALALLAVMPSAAAAQNPNAEKKRRDANAARYVQQLTARFKTWDTKRDNKLDKKELAAAFRGAGARPFDYAPPTPRQQALLVLNGLIGLPPYVLHANHTAAEVLALRAPPVTAPRSADPSGLADYQFLILAGNTSSTTLSKGEFDSWARGFAGSVADQDYYRRLLQLAQAKLNKANKAKKGKAKTAAQRAAQAEVQRYQQSLQDANTQVNSVPQAVQRAFALKR